METIDPEAKLRKDEDESASDGATGAGRGKDMQNIYDSEKRRKEGVKEKEEEEDMGGERRENAPARPPNMKPKRKGGRKGKRLTDLDAENASESDTVRQRSIVPLKIIQNLRTSGRRAVRMNLRRTRNRRGTSTFRPRDGLQEELASKEGAEATTSSSTTIRTVIIVRRRKRKALLGEAEGKESSGEAKSWRKWKNIMKNGNQILGDGAEQHQQAAKRRRSLDQVAVTVRQGHRTGKSRK